VWWEFVAAVATAAASVLGTTWAYRAIIRHEQKACDQRMDAFREGLDRKP
jgi:hypothetical protein